jgi:hypothetical protein
MLFAPDKLVLHLAGSMSTHGCPKNDRRCDEDVYSFESLQRLRYNMIRFRIGVQVAKGECRIRAFCSKCIQQRICLRGITAMDNDSSALGRQPPDDRLAYACATSGN